MRLKFSCTMKESDKTIVHLVTKLNSASSSSLSWPRFYTTTVSPLERDRTVDDWRSDVVWFSIWSYQFTSTLVPATYMKSLQMMKAVIENNDTPTNIQPNSDGWTCWFTVPSHDLVSPKGQYIMEVVELDIFTCISHSLADDAWYVSPLGSPLCVLKIFLWYSKWPNYGRTKKLRCSWPSRCEPNSI